MRAVDWSTYAKEYDLMAQHNPAYQELLRHCVGTVCGWPLQSGDMVADIGGGTGNFSVALARALPAVTILHADFDEAMLKIAHAKSAKFGLTNWRAVRMDVEQEVWELPALAGIVTVHSLYSFKNPQRVIGKMCAQLQPGGHVYACDIGRVMNVYDWGRYLVMESFRKNGLWQTIKLFNECGEVRRQNQRVAICQKAGVYWTHELAEFAKCFEEHGMKILTATDTLYRGYDDLVISQKPLASVR